jgi:hypothetical protein
MSPEIFVLNKLCKYFLYSFHAIKNTHMWETYQCMDIKDLTYLINFLNLMFSIPKCLVK